MKIVSRLRGAGLALAACFALSAFAQPAGAAVTLNFLGSVEPPPPGSDVTYVPGTLRGTLECSVSCMGLLSNFPAGVYPGSNELPPASSANGFGGEADLFDLANSSDASELAFVNANVNPDFVSGTKGHNNAGGMLMFISGAEYLLFKIGTDPNYALIKNTSPGQTFKYTEVSGQGAGISHITSFGSATVIPLPASLPLLLAGLAGIGLLGRRRRAA